LTGAALSSFRLDIVSDTICPWCYVGKRRLAAALPILEAEGLTFDVAWCPFQLNPTMPREGLDRRAYRSAKFGSWEKSHALDAQVTEAGASAGLVFRHDLMAKTPNTVASHALIHLARETGDAAMQDGVVEALFSAYFTQGLDVGDPAVLAGRAGPTPRHLRRAAVAYNELPRAALPRSAGRRRADASHAAGVHLMGGDLRNAGVQFLQDR
jgi:predicted DsbA family dithiol-disulfide isomerase